MTSPTAAASAPARNDATHGTIHLTSLGCSRNDVDSEELAGRLAAAGWTLVDDPSGADVNVVNTCGFVAEAKKDSIDTILDLADLKESGETRAVVAVGCLAERYGRELAEQMPEADGVFGFDSYKDMSDHLSRILAGEQVQSHVPRDRRSLLPISPIARQETAPGIVLPGHGDLGPDATAGETFVRARLDGAPWAPLKIASGCDRRCAFCAIPSFRGAFVSRRPSDVLAEARWLGSNGVKEAFLVSENSTSYGKDLGDIRLLDTLLPDLAEVEGLERIRVSYLQPAELRDDLVRAIVETEKVVPYFDLSFQHVSAKILRRMRRFGDPESFLSLIEKIRSLAPEAGIRSNVIVGFPGETEEDFQMLVDFVTAARLDVCGVFGYSDEDGTEAQGYEDKVEQEVIDERLDILSTITESAGAERAAERIGSQVSVLVESNAQAQPWDEDLGEGSFFEGDRIVFGRAEHQGPEVDGLTRLVQSSDGAVQLPEVGQLISARVVSSEGADLVAVIS
ncbi:30S ribosomal protein S12 methylthiotransferase RimO [Dermatophilus congolensis]|uniref:Ribosomal protein uS12 methylthiotransferase RimO n=1 Tax=Dermatophilus congolensis TaxID=1863 RepID=A0AA46H045_9MICO|nr:30S ribosomal protein S12 methylthiotransferase RimO [Dermatophilus congolensis]MBO3142618.1 30S ribosomal protein S12 methylthiotransferase RimO [Dermatophilus congolensis]MBO3151608.1 30S ribosomal protein S12 methylthiotransferase RimO [Dermatophilus congolensis]MBO3161391.1 30S ribosomal protein S12 methylthiotransferase RimO [Dermatophilus congolensis]MBO3162891.1 30S ribosomal protein S12 methylthiotransferase RimO [Dermatophilus congolensis]MBO3176444.1 30S ribosomal protein S12 meth